MTVTTTATYSELVGNGSATAFPFTFAAASPSEVRVTVDDVVQSGGFSVSLNAAGTGGTVYFDTTPASGAAILIESVPVFTQEAKFASEGSFNPATFDKVHDRLVISDLYLKDRVDRALILPRGATGDLSELAPGQFLVTDADGNITGASGTGADAGLRADLAASGSTLVGYGTTTVSAELGNLVSSAKAQPQAQAFWREVRSNQKDVYILVCGDSTGDAPNEWPYLTAVALASLIPTHTIKYRQWLDGIGWSSTTTLATGTGARTLYFDNISVAGSTAFYLDGARTAQLFDGTRPYILAIYNYGHNTGSTTTEEQNLPAFVAQIANLLLMFPRAGILLTLQNPRTDFPDHTANMVSALSKVARMLSVGVIDVYSAFQRATDPSSLYLDGTHPNAAGSLLWRDVVLAAIAEDPAATRSASQPASPLSVVRPNIAANPTFSDWPAGVSTPRGWTFSNVTPTKDAGRGEFGYGVKLTNGAGTNPKMTQDLSQYLAAFRGRYVSFAARVWAPTGLDGLGGRIDLTASDQVSLSTSGTSFVRGGTEARDGWTWAFATVLVPSWAISLVASIYTGAADGSDNGESLWVERVWLGEGQVPGAVDFDAYSPKVLSDYYSSGNVGKLATNTGTLTASADDITVTGATAPHSEIFINMPGLVKDGNYSVRWTYVSDTSGLGGSVLLRSGVDGGYATLQTKTMADGRLDFTAPAGAVCLQVFANSTATGWVVNDWSIKPLFSGIGTPVNLPLLLGRNADGSVIDATGGAGKFSQVVTLGTASYLAGEAAQGNTKTDVALFELALGTDYVAGRPLTVTLNANTFGAGTAGTRTLRVYAYRVAANGSQGANLGPAAQNLTGAAADYSFAVDGTTLSPGDLLVIKVEAVVQETGSASGLQARVSSVRVS